MENKITKQKPASNLFIILVVGLAVYNVFYGAYCYLIGGIAGATMGIMGALAVSKVAGLFLGENIFIISISWSLLIGAVLFSFFIGILSGIIPASQASKTQVVDALRG